MKQLIQFLIKKGCLKSLNIIEAFAAVDRADFVPVNLREKAYEDRPLRIGFGQTISQPAVVAFMLEQLDPHPEEIILDVGFGSGWQTVLLARLVGERGKVVAVERISELYSFGRKNCEKYGYKNIEFVKGDATAIDRGENYFDKIIVAASSKNKIPEIFKKQLKNKGKIVIPVRESIFVLTKENEKKFSEKEFPGFLFVPLIKD
ncbi:MAG: protein-L-isoaspartate O-methyltransferase [Candidatus Paceibacterota bacterium]